MDYRYSFSTETIEVQPQFPFQIQNPPQGWNRNLHSDQRRKLIRPYIIHILQNPQQYPAFVGYRTWTEVYSFYDDNYEYHKDEHRVNKRQSFINCLIGNDFEEYWF